MTNYEFEKLASKHHVATPRWVVESIYNLVNITRFKNVWLPFNHYDSEFKLKADELKLLYKATHKFDDLGNDFFTTPPPCGCELLISNPPFNIQNEILQHSFDLIEKGKVEALALLLPLSTLETPTRAALWEKYSDKLSLIIFKKRIRFIGAKTSFNTACCWIIYGIPNLPKISWL